MDGVDQNLGYDGDAEESGDVEDGSEEETIDKSSNHDEDLGGEDGDDTTVYLDVDSEEKNIQINS